MSAAAATTLILAVQVYAMIGLIIGVAFLLFGIHRADPAAQGAHAFRPLLLPGLVLLWPLVIWRTFAGPR